MCSRGFNRRVLMISTFLSPIAISRSPISRSPISRSPDRTFPPKSPDRPIAHFPQNRPFPEISIARMRQSDVTTDNTAKSDTAPYRFPTPKNPRPLLSNIAQIAHSLQTQEMHPAQRIASYNCHSIRRNSTAIKPIISPETSNLFTAEQIPDFEGFI